MPELGRATTVILGKRYELPVLEAAPVVPLHRAEPNAEHELVRFPPATVTVALLESVGAKLLDCV